MEFTGTDRRDTINGTEDDDVIHGLASNDRLIGHGGDDLIEGGLGFDTLFGGDGDDTLQGGGHDDDADGGLGDDLIEGGDGDDYLVDSSGFDTLLGGAGIDELIVLDGGDRLEGGDGDDVLHVEAKHAQGETTVLGGAGDDFVVLRHVGFSALISMGKGTDVANLNAATALTVMGGGGDDFIRPGAADAIGRLIAMGGAGDDQIVLAMAHGNEGLRRGDGGSGADMMIVGCFGKTRVTLGEGSDQLIFSQPDDLGVLPETVVRIADFQAGDGGDSIDVDYLFRGFFGLDWTSPGDLFELGYLRVVEEGSATCVEVDFDADGGAYGWTRVGALAGVDAADLTAANFNGYDPDAAP